MAVYYNDMDPYAAAWLRRLIGAGLIPEGDVDERDIRNVSPSDLREYRQCHFFAGFGGWAAILDQVDWPENREIWTGSCPCRAQDEQQLWPEFFRLIEACRPRMVLGGQAGGKLGAEWLAAVMLDCEEFGYEVAAAGLPAAAVAAPQIGERFWFGASAGSVTAGWPVLPRDRVSWATLHKGVWADSEYVPCADGRIRRIGPNIVPLGPFAESHRRQSAVIANAVVPSVGAVFLRAWLAAENEAGQVAPQRWNPHRHRPTVIGTQRREDRGADEPVARFQSRPPAEWEDQINGPLFAGIGEARPLQRRLAEILAEDISAGASPECELNWRDCPLPGWDSVPLLAARLRADGDLGIWQPPDRADEADRLQKQLLAVLGEPKDSRPTQAVFEQLDWLDAPASESPAQAVAEGRYVRLADLCDESSMTDPAFSLWLMGYPSEWLRCAPDVAEGAGEAPPETAGTPKPRTAAVSAV